MQNTARNTGEVDVFHREPSRYAVTGNRWNPIDTTGSGNEWDDVAVFGRN